VEIEGSADSNEDAARLYDALAGRGQDDAAAEAGQAAEAMWKLPASGAEGASFGEIGLDGLPGMFNIALRDEVTHQIK
jgi:hypothetical protein